MRKNVQLLMMSLLCVLSQEIVGGMAKRLLVASGIGTCGIIGRSMWPFNHKKDEVDKKGEADRVMYSLHFETTEIDVTSSDDSGNKVEIPASIIGRKPLAYSDKYDGTLRGTLEVLPGINSMLKICLEKGSCFPPSITMVVKVYQPYEKLTGALDLAVKIYWGSWNYKKYDNYRKGLVTKPLSERLVFEYNSYPTVEIPLPRHVLSLFSEPSYLKCSRSEIRVDNKPGIQVRCGKQTITVMSTSTYKELPYRISTSSGDVEGVAR